MGGEGDGVAVDGAAEERAGVLSIGGLYDEVEAALSQSFPRKRHLWVRGEIQHLSDHRSGHLYLDLVDPEEDAGRGGARGGRGGQPVLKVKCWRTSWTPLRHSLGKEGIELAEGMVVVLRGSLDLYRAKGELSFILADIDVTALLGRLAAQRTALLRARSRPRACCAATPASHCRTSCCTSGSWQVPRPRAVATSSVS